MDEQSTRRSAFVLGLLVIFAPFCIDTFLPVAPQLVDEFGVDPAVAQLSLSACLLGLAVGQLIAGPLSDRIGRRGPLLGGVTTFTLTAALSAVAPDMTVLVLARFLQGVGAAGAIVVARAIARDYFTGADLARAFAVILGVAAIGPIAAPLIGAGLAAVTDWRGSLLAVAGIGALLLLVAVLGTRESLPKGSRHPHMRALWDGARRLARDRAVIASSAIVGLFSIAHFGFVTASSFVFQDYYGVGESTFALLFVITAIAIAAGAQGSRPLVRRIGVRRTLGVGVGGGVLSAVFLLALVLLGTGVPGMMIGASAVLLFLGVVVPNALTLAMLDHPRTAGLAAALIGTLQFATGALTSPIVAAIGYRPVVLAGTMIVGTAGAAIVYVTRLAGPEDHRAGDA